jgi:hypothetical protein
VVKATPRTEPLVRELRRLAAALAPDLPFASPAARDEWRRVQATWPSDLELRRGDVPLSDDALKELVAKARRFAAILRAEATRR